MKSIIINPSYGNNPYLRATEIALKVKEILEEEFVIVVPHVYGKQQERILEEEFKGDTSIILDEKFGTILKQIFFGGDSYQEHLSHWIEHSDFVGKQAHDYLSTTYDIAMEISRSPLIALGIQPAYYTSFSRTSSLLGRAAGKEGIAINDDDLKQAAKLRKKIEDPYALHFITVPGTFEPEKNDIPIPLTMALPLVSGDAVKEGIYVTLSGIPKADVDVMKEIANHFGTRLYTNDTSKLPNATWAPQNIIASPRIIAHIARPGWGSTWMSLCTDTPLIMPPYNLHDDPEIYFNIRRIEELGIGAVFQGQSLGEVLKQKPGIAAYRKNLEKRFSGLDGCSIAARKIAEDFLRKKTK